METWKFNLLLYLSIVFITVTFSSSATMSNLQPNLSKTINFSEFQNDFFSEFNQWDEMKYLLLFFHTMISFIAPVLMFSIIWYENNGCAAHYRTVINILLCNTCIINTLRGFVTRVPHAIMIIFSPMSMTFCDGILHD